MTNEELLVAMSGMMDEKLTPIKEDISGLKEDVSGLKKDVAVLQEDVSELKEDVSDLKVRMTNVEMVIENDLVPGMRELCTVVNTEYKKYEIWVKDHDRMQTNMDALNSVVSKHTEQISELQQVCGL